MYDHARKIAVESRDLNDDELYVPGAVEGIMNASDAEKDKGLNNLDLDIYNEHIIETEGGDKRLSLEDCRVELYTKGFKEKRCPYEPPDREQLFYMLSKETAESLRPGKLCVAYVQGNLILYLTYINIKYICFFRS